MAFQKDGLWYVLDPYRKVLKDGKLQSHITDPIPLAVYTKSNPILKSHFYQSSDSRLQS